MCYIKGWLAIFLTALLHTVFSSPVAPNNLHLPKFSSNKTNLLTDFKNLGSLPIPTAFQIHPESHPIEIAYEPNAIFTNAIQAIEETAIGDIQGYMPLWKFKTARYPQPVITLGTPLWTSIKREYVIWGLLLAVISMISREAFEMTQFTLLWHGDEVGSITFGDFYSMLDSPGRVTGGTVNLRGDIEQNTSMATTGTGARTNNSTVYQANGTKARNSPSLSEERLSVVFRSSGDDVGVDNLLTYMLVVLAQTAIPPSDSETTKRWTPTAFGRVCRFILTRTARVEPPFMMFFWLIGAVAKAARYVIENDAYRTLHMVIYVDGELIGRSAFVCVLPNSLDNI